MHEKHWGIFLMEMTMTQKLLAYGLKQFPISRENLETVYLFLYESEEKMKEMIKFLALHEKATEQEIMTELARILKEN